MLTSSRINNLAEVELTVRDVYSKHYPMQDITRCQIKFEYITSGPYTCVLWCEPVGSGLPRMLIKQKIKTDQDVDTQIEYETMANLWELGYDSETSLRIPRPFHYDIKNNFIVTEFIQGRKLSRILAFNLRYPMCFFQTNQNIEYIRRTALWLTEYEKKVETTQLTKLADTVKVYLDYKVDDIHFLNSDEKDGLKTSIQEYAKSLDFIPSLLTNLDFKPHNIIINKIATVGIDWEKMKDKCVVFWMPATFLRYLDNAKIKLSVSNRAVSKIKKEFLRTYWNNTPFHKSKNIFPLICSLESITYLAESKPTSKKIQVQTIESIKTNLRMK